MSVSWPIIVKIGLELSICMNGAKSEKIPQLKRENYPSKSCPLPAFSVLAGAPTRDGSAISSSDEEDREDMVLRRYSEIWESIPARNSLSSNHWPLN